MEGRDDKQIAKEFVAKAGVRWEGSAPRPQEAQAAMVMADVVGWILVECGRKYKDIWPHTESPQAGGVQGRWRNHIVLGTPVMEESRSTWDSGIQGWLISLYTRKS